MDEFYYNLIWADASDQISTCDSDTTTSTKMKETIEDSDLEKKCKKELQQELFEQPKLESDCEFKENISLSIKSEPESDLETVKKYEISKRKSSINEQPYEEATPADDSYLELCIKEEVSASPSKKHKKVQHIDNTHSENGLENNSDRKKSKKKKNKFEEEVLDVTVVKELFSAEETLVGTLKVEDDTVITQNGYHSDHVNNVHCLPQETKQPLCLARLSASSRSRSVTPSERGGGAPIHSAARRALIMGLISERPEPELSPSPPPLPRPAHALLVHATPGGSLYVQDKTVPVEQTPGGHLRCVQREPTVPLCIDVVERVEAMDMSVEDAEDVMSEVPWHVDRWVTDLLDSAAKSPLPQTPSATSNVTANSEVAVFPSTSGLTATSRRAPRCEVGSDLDSEFDDEFDMPGVAAGAGAGKRDVPEMEELEEPMQQIVYEMDTAMDDAADCLLGTSASFTWVSDFESFRAVREEFSGPNPGPLKDYDSPYDAFIDIWDKDIIELIVLETNRYAQQIIGSKRSTGNLTPSSRLHSWTDTNADEIMVLFAMFMYMAIDSRTRVAEYWAQHGVLQLPGFRRLMSYNRYLLLCKFLHFVDNTAVASQQLSQTGEPYTARLSAKLGKLVPIIEHLEKKFKSLYNVGPDISIDESLTLFKGRLSWVQTIRSKSARFGIKSYELCESSTGYMAGFQIYTGKSDGSSGGDPSLGVNLGAKSTKVVLELLQGLEHRGHCVVMDNFYNCPSLARYLKCLGFDCLGTLRVCRRNVPSDIAKVPKKVKKGTIISRHCGDVSIISWMDSKMVNIISTFHHPDTYVGTRAGKAVVKPVCVRDYNKSMGGVDLKDQKLSMYLLERKRGVKWYIKMFKRLMNVSIHNALVMYVSSLKRRGELPVTHREFRYELAEDLVRQHRPCLPEISRPVGDLMRLRRDIVHEPDYLKGRESRRRCVMCARKKENKLIHTKCAQCDVYLCFRDCWRIWHSTVDLPGEDIRGRKRRRT